MAVGQEQFKNDVFAMMEAKEKEKEKEKLEKDGLSWEAKANEAQVELERVKAEAAKVGQGAGNGMAGRGQGVAAGYAVAMQVVEEEGMPRWGRLQGRLITRDVSRAAALSTRIGSARTSGEGKENSVWIRRRIRRRRL